MKFHFNGEIGAPSALSVRYGVSVDATDFGYAIGNSVRHWLRSCLRTSNVAEVALVAAE